jgi:ATP dependent DNA ligase domain
VLVALAHAAVLAEKEKGLLDLRKCAGGLSISYSQQEMEQGEINITFRRRCPGYQVCLQVRHLFLSVCWSPHVFSSELPNYDLVVPALLEAGIDGLPSKCKLTPGVPLKPMLAKPTKAIGEVLDRFEGKKFTCEYKYDGERAQVGAVLDVSYVPYVESWKTGA